MIQCICDHCQQPINRDQHEWYGLDHEPTPPPPTNDDEYSEHDLLIQLDTDRDYDHHFCSTACLTNWAMNQTLDHD